MKFSLARRPGGCLVVKDWEPWPSFSHLLCYFSCRYITGDRVRYPTAADLHALLDEGFSEGTVVDEFRLPPSKHNLAVVLQTPELWPGQPPPVPAIRTL